MDDTADVLLLHAVLAWCEDCDAEQLLVPADEDGVPGGLCCTVCDAAVFVLPAETTSTPLRRSA